MQLEHGEAVRLLGHRFLDLPGMLVDSRFAAGDDLRHDREAVARRRLGKDRSIAALLNVVWDRNRLLESPLLRVLSNRYPCQPSFRAYSASVANIASLEFSICDSPLVSLLPRAERLHCLRLIHRLGVVFRLSDA